ncbi:MAG: hypothetical protein IT384_05300 [Deltaproteobacteria bacterium]|nr:hypothetical protein [Deltaproteobacteria bacterium]
MRARPNRPKTGRRRRARRAEARGFVLIGIMLMVAMMVAAVTVSLRGSTDSLREASQMKNAEIAQAALTHGINMAMDKIQVTDPATYMDMTLDFDIFDDPFLSAPWVPPETYPTAGPYANEMNIRVGYRPGQRTSAPAGEDVRNSYGFVVEVQVSAEATRFGAQAEERIAMGLQVPHQYSYSK